jgi:hypothetical protein
MKTNYNKIATVTGAIIGMLLMSASLKAGNSKANSNTVITYTKLLNVTLSADSTGENILIELPTEINSSIQMVMIMVMNASGRIVMNEAIEFNSDTQMNPTSMNVSNLAIGEYTLLVYQNGKYYSKQFTKVNILRF